MGFSRRTQPGVMFRSPIAPTSASREVRFCRSSSFMASARRANVTPFADVGHLYSARSRRPKWLTLHTGAVLALRNLSVTSRSYFIGIAGHDGGGLEAQVAS